MSKVKVYEKNSVASIINERKLLAQLRHPFIINMHYAFEDRENLYIIMDYLSGGDLRYHICKQRKFDEEKKTTETTKIKAETEAKLLSPSQPTLILDVHNLYTTG